MQKKNTLLIKFKLTLCRMWTLKFPAPVLREKYNTSINPDLDSCHGTLTCKNLCYQARVVIATASIRIRWPNAWSSLQLLFGGVKPLLLHSRSVWSHMKLPTAMSLLQTSIHSFLKINQSQSKFQFLVDVRAKNVYQSMAGQGFSRKEHIKKTTYAAIGAAYMVTPW